VGHGSNLIDIALFVVKTVLTENVGASLLYCFIEIYVTELTHMRS